MPTVAIPFGPSQASGQESLAGASPIAMNVVREKSGAVRRRPGIAEYSAGSVAGAVSGMHLTLGGALYAVVEGSPNRPIYRVTPGAVAALGGGLPPVGVIGAARPVFAETEMLLVISGGSEIQKLELATGVSDRLGGSPPQASHVITNAQRLLANDVAVDRTKVRYSSQAQGTTTYAGHEQWSIGAGTAGFFTAEARPDPVVALGETTNEVFVWGQTTTEVYGADPVFRFSRIAAMELGMGAGYSGVRSEQLHYWLDHKRRFIAASTRDFQPISENIQADLDQMSRVDDCFGYRVNIGWVDAIVWTFPTDGRTYVFQQGVGWGQWCSAVGGSPNQFQVTACADEVLVGTSGGRFGVFDLSASTDFGVPILSYVETGFKNHDTDAYKECLRVTLTLRRGETDGTVSPSGWLKFRDRPGPWEIAGPIDLGRSGDSEITLELSSLGTYRRREWRFEFSGEDELVLVSAVEEFEITE